MATDEPKKQIEELLLELGNTSLRKSHNSVNISFTQMLAYIDKIRGPIPDGDIKLLLKTYREMAERFYTQYESSLLQEIKKLGVVRRQVASAIGQLDKNTTDVDAMKTAKDFLTEDSKAATLEYETLIKNFPTLLQNALDKLKAEWQRLDTIAVASQTLTKDENLVRTLNIVIESAAFSVGIEAERIAIVPGDAFALNFFTYLENFAVLTAPIYSVQAPWEWSIFWHELAGYKVRQLENDMTLTTIRKNWEDLHKLYETIDRTIDETIDTEQLTYYKAHPDRDPFLSLIARDNPFTPQYICELFSKAELDLSDLGSFEYQFERMLENLQIENKSQNYDQIKADGWCVDWFKELFEDAWSVLEFSHVFDEGFLVYFQDILSRHDVTDGRHPPKEIRLSVAKELVSLKVDATPPGLEDASIEQYRTEWPEGEEIVTITKSAAKQILRFMSLIIAADSYRIFKFDEFPMWREGLAARTQILRVVGWKITEEMQRWSRYLLTGDDSASKVIYHAKNEIEDYSKDPRISEHIQTLEKVTKKKEIVPSYEELLKDKDYKQLLDISFYDIDFGTPTATYTFAYDGTTYKITEPNLKSAKGTYIFEKEQGSSNKITINNASYWTTSANIKALKDSKKWIT